MNLSEGLLPTGFHYHLLGEVDSTNLEAHRQIQAGAASGSWFVADRQTGGKGTHGRDWQSPGGNLYASLFLRLPTPAALLPQLSILAGLAAHTAIEQVGGLNLNLGELCLKWPNDILLRSGKLCGILLENRAVNAPDAAPGSHDVIIGIGVNIGSAPEIEQQIFAPTALRQERIETTAEALFVELARAMRDWIAIWRDGDGFEELRLAWLQRSCHIGQLIEIETGETTLRGRFTTINHSGALMLVDEAGREHTITSGHLIAVDHSL